MFRQKLLILSSFVDITTVGLKTRLSVLNIYGKYKTPLLRHIWVYIHIEIENIQWITFSAYALLWEYPCLRFSDRIYNRLQNTGKYKLLNDMRIVLVQFIHY